MRSRHPALRAVEVDPASLPTAGQIVAAMPSNALGGEEYDKAWPARAKAELW